MDDPGQRQLNIHMDPEHLGGVYANFANITFSNYEFTITFARIDHEVGEGEIPGVVVTRVNMSPRFTPGTLMPALSMRVRLWICAVERIAISSAIQPPSEWPTT